MISRNEADAALTGLGATHDRMAAAMYSLDVHSGLRLLRGGTLTGRTAERWRALSPEVDLVWAHFSAVGDILEQARAVRGRRRLEDSDWAELTRLLREPVVGLGADGLPVDVSGVPASRIGVEDLAQRLEKRVADLLGQLSEVDAAWTAVASAVGRVTTEVDAVTALAAQLGEPAATEALRAALAEIERLDVGDPLVAAPGGRLTDAARGRFDALAAAADRTRRQLADIVRLRDGYAERRAGLESLVDAVAAAEAAVPVTYQRVAEKIADPGLAPVPAAAAVLRARLPDLDRLAFDGRWRAVADHLSIVESSATQARDRAAELTRVADDLLARRDELRGRLEAYRAKAAARGLAEHDDLAARYTRAHDLLFTAPCDLRASTRAVHDYQRTLAGALGSGERSALDD